MDPITLVLRSSKSPPASAPVGGELSSAECDANWNNLKTAAEQLDAEKLSAADAQEITSTLTALVGSDEIFVLRSGVVYKAALTAVRSFLEGQQIEPGLFSNSQTFYGPTVTQPSSSVSSTFIGINSRSGDGAFANFTNPAPASGQRLVVILAGEAFNPRTFTITVNGGGTISPTEIVALGDNTTAIFETAAPAGSTITIAFTSGAGSGTVNCGVYTVDNGTLRDSAAITGTSPQSVTLDVAANGLVIAGLSTEWYNGSTLAFTAGVTSDGSNANSFRVGSASGLSANATYTVTGTSTVWQPYIVAVTFQP